MREPWNQIWRQLAVRVRDLPRLEIYEGHVDNAECE